MAKTNGLDDKIEQRIAPVADLYNENGASPSSIVCNFISWSPDGKMLVYNISRQQGSGYAELWIMDTQSRKAKKIYSNEVAEYPSFLDNATIIFSDISDIKTISVSGRNAHVIINNGNKPSVCHLNK